VTERGLGHRAGREPDTVAGVFLEPLQNAGGSLTPPAGYHQGIREI
jgi:adenosylmethionine-8-amino-7-oxononanoate aminotransferase